MLLIASNTLFSQASSPPSGKMVITFTDIRSDKGRIALALYNQASQWTENPMKKMAWTKEDMRNGRMTVEVPSIPYDTYAIAVLDDENKSNDMEYRLGLPLEGWGMSTNPSFLSLKQPAFDEVSFELDAPVVRFEIKMNYLNKNKNVK